MKCIILGYLLLASVVQLRSQTTSSSSSPASLIEQDPTARQPLPLRVEGNRLKTPGGAVVRLQGVNIASLE